MRRRTPPLVALLLGALPAAGRAQGTLWTIFTETGGKALEQGRHPQAEKNFKAALEEAQARATEGTAEVVYRLALSHHNLAYLYSRVGRDAEAQPHFDEAILLMEQTEGQQEKVLLITSLQRLGLMHQGAGRLAEARTAFERALAKAQAMLAQGDEGAMEVVDALARTYLLADQREAAEALFRSTIATLEKRPRQNARQIARILGELGDLYEAQGSHMLADALYRRSVELYEASGVRDGEALAAALVRRARGDLRREESGAAAAGYRRALGLYRKLGGRATFEMAEALHAQASMRYREKSWEEVVPLARESLDVLQRADHPRARELAYRNYRLLAKAHRERGHFKQAETLFKRMLQLYASRPGLLAEVQREYAALLERVGRADEAAALRAAAGGEGPESRALR